MPYIKQEERAKFDNALALLPIITTPGELNYIVTSVCKKYLEQFGVSYGNINSVVGVLECAKLELYRRAAAPYEEIKRRENGDVY